MTIDQIKEYNGLVSIILKRLGISPATESSYVNNKKIIILFAACAPIDNSKLPVFTAIKVRATPTNK